MTKRVCIGKIAGPHGIKGLVKIKAYCDDRSLLENDTPLFIAETGAQTLCGKITFKNSTGKYLLATIDGIKDRTDAENMDRSKLWVERDVLPDTDDDEIYIEDMIGLRVESPDGAHVGTIKALENYGASDLLEITLLSGQDIMIPYDLATLQDDKVIADVTDWEL
jgi:16S rRNA processing protein RimM